jgi:hypothetical protein
VLAGFCVQEIVQGGAKDDLSSISSSIALYNFKAELAQASTGGAKSEIDPIRFSATMTAKDAQKTLEEFGSTSFRIQAAFLAARDLYGSLRVKEDDLKRQGVVGDKASSDLIATFWDLDAKQANPNYSNAYDDDLSFTQKLNGFSSLYESFAQQVVNSAESELHEDQKRVKWSTIISYILFAVGWVSGMIGKVLRLPALSVGGE